MDLSNSVIASAVGEDKAARLGKRLPSFELMAKHLKANPGGYIIETGTARGPESWEGDGQSTLIWDAMVNVSMQQPISIDIHQGAVDNAAAQTRYVQYICHDSVQALASLPATTLERCRLLYLDSFDWNPELNMESAFHHLAELTTVYASLSSGCMIVVDDRHGDFMGKHHMVEYFFNKLGIEPVFKEYQIGWIKP